MLICWKAAVGCPRDAKIRRFVEELLPFVGSDEALTTNADKIKAIIGKINHHSRNYCSYVRPSEEELGKGAMTVLSSLITKLDKGTYLIVERVTYKAIWKHCSIWFHSFFCKESQLNVGGAVNLVECTSRHRVIIHGSRFVTMAEEATLQSQMNAVESFWIFK